MGQSRKRYNSQGQFVSMFFKSLYVRNFVLGWIHCPKVQPSPALRPKLRGTLAIFRYLYRNLTVLTENMTLKCTPGGRSMHISHYFVCKPCWHSIYGHWGYFWKNPDPLTEKIGLFSSKITFFAILVVFSPEIFILASILPLHTSY